MNQRRIFSPNIFKSIFFWLGPFLALIFEFKITKIFLLIMNRLDWGKRSKVKPKSFCFEVLSSKFISPFSVLILFLIFFLCLFYVLICLYCLVLVSLCVSENVKLLDLLFWSSTLFSMLLRSWLKFLWPNLCMHNSACARRLNYAYVGLFICMILPKNPSSSFYFVFFAYFTCYASVLILFFIIYIDLSLYFTCLWFICLSHV